MNSERFDRQVAWFGELGQSRIRDSHCVIIGVGGLGTHLVQQLALLGVGNFTLVDDEEVSETNRNRYVGLRYNDPIPGFRKVDLGERIANDIDPSIAVHKVYDSLLSADGFAAVRAGDFVFGGLDSEGARLVLNELCAAYRRPYFDLASDIIPGTPVEYGGRVCFSHNGNCCLQCLRVLDTKEAAQDLAGDAERQNRESVYGVPHELLGQTGPSVVSINGGVASLAVTEFIAAVTGIREPQRGLTYQGTSGKVLVNVTEPSQECFVCKGLWGTGRDANVERYLALADRLRPKKATVVVDLELPPRSAVSNVLESALWTLLRK